MAMKLYWQERRAGQRLILSTDDEGEIEVGAVRSTSRGFDALAKTNTYDPGRAQKGFSTIEEAKAFVEGFHPWDIFGGDLDLEVEPEVRTLPNQASATADDEPEQPVAETEDHTPEVPQSNEPAARAPEPQKPGWQFWKRG